MRCSGLRSSRLSGYTTERECSSTWLELCTWVETERGCRRRGRHHGWHNIGTGASLSVATRRFSDNEVATQRILLFERCLTCGGLVSVGLMVESVWNRSLRSDLAESEGLDFIDLTTLFGFLYFTLKACANVVAVASRCRNSDVVLDLLSLGRSHICLRLFLFLFLFLFLVFVF